MNSTRIEPIPRSLRSVLVHERFNLALFPFLAEKSAGPEHRRRMCGYTDAPPEQRPVEPQVIGRGGEIDCEQQRIHQQVDAEMNVEASQSLYLQFRGVVSSCVIHRHVCIDSKHSAHTRDGHLY